METRILILLVCLLLACGTAIFLAIISTHCVKSFISGKDIFASDESENVCQTKECVLTAATILSNMDESVDPCDNFYRFACNNFEENTVLGSSKSLISLITIVSDKVDEQVGLLFEETFKLTDPKFVKLVKKFYHSCMNTALIDRMGMEPLLRNLKALGGWPILDGDSWDGSTFNWTNIAYKFRQFGYPDNYFFDLSPNVDKKNSSRRRITIDQPSLGLRREYMTRPGGLKEPEVMGYRKYQVSIAILLGADPTRANREMLEVLKFEMRLANLSITIVERRNLTRQYRPMTIQQLQSRWKSIPWLEFINNHIPESVKMSEDDVVIMAAPEYFDGFETIIQETDKRVIANYAMWRAVHSSINYLSEKFRTVQFDLIASLSGLKEREPRWRECIAMTSESLGHAVGALYVRHHFNEESKKDVLEMAGDIKDAFIGILNELDWMDPVTKKRAIEKAKTMYTHVGYPVELWNDTILDEFYDGLELNSWDYLGNHLNVTRFLANHAYGQLCQLVNKTDWRTHGKPAVVNAYYGPYENAIEVPAGILQGNYYNNRRPKYMNYGAIGMVIGHELSHGFDDRGSLYDADGNMNNWWEEATRKAFLDQTQCIIEQYRNYTVKELGMHLSGLLTESENIADNAGLKEAYRAYHAWLQRNEPEPRLPGLTKYTPNQLFWISSANVWCNKFKKESLKLRILTGVHPPGEFRIIGAVSNMPAFSKDFSCPLGTNMNPVHKCSIW